MFYSGKNQCKECKKVQRIKKHCQKIQEENCLKQNRKTGLKNRTGAEARKISKKKYHEKYPEKRAAHLKTMKMKSVVIGNVLHHWSYNEEDYKDVIEITRDHHEIIHTRMSYDQDYMMYKTKPGGVLLCTKRMHEEYINNIIEKQSLQILKSA